MCNTIGINLIDGTELLETTWKQKAASDYSASIKEPFQGVGFNIYAFCFDTSLSTVGAHLEPFLENLVPDDIVLQSSEVEDISKKLHASITVQFDYSKVSETKSPDCVQEFHIEVLNSLFNGKMITSTRSKFSLDSIGCGYGPASKISVPDILFTDRNNKPRGIGEAKHNMCAPAEGLRQGVSESINIAYKQLLDGVVWSKVAVPNVGLTGCLIQFSLIVFLPPSFPVVVEISRVFDLRYPGDRRIAAGYIQKLAVYLERPLQAHFDPIESTNAPLLGISKSLYHFKNLQTDYFMSMPTLQQSLGHFLRAMEALFRDVDCRRYTLFPICIREFGSDNSELVFTRLNDFRIGLPANEMQRQSFLAEVKRAATAFHSARIVHLDFYPSNIMWKEDPSDSEAVIIKVIDWDAVQFADEGITSAARSRLSCLRSELAKYSAAKLHRSVVLDDHDNSLIDVLDYYLSDEGLQTEVKAELDARFRELQSSFLQEANASLIASTT